MKNLLLTLLLVCPFSFADWGDVYYCQMTSFVVTNSDGTVEQYKQQKFQFKLDSTEKAMVFGKGGMFHERKLTVDPNVSWVKGNSWWASTKSSLISFDKGVLMFSRVYTTSIYSISADCDKF